MTVPIYNLLTQYTGTGSRTFFEYGFEIFDDTNVLVLVNGALVTFVMQDTGVVISPAPALNSTILIYRETDVTQLRDFQPFEFFKADKTESAMDKLIYLKQEADLWRALMNLRALPYVERVDVVNDKGTDAVLFLWNLDKAGMFSGELTDDMPNPGTVVEKPWDFAYFECSGAGPTPPTIPDYEYFLFFDNDSDQLRYFGVDFDTGVDEEFGSMPTQYAGPRSVTSDNQYVFVPYSTSLLLGQYVWRGNVFSKVFSAAHGGANNIKHMIQLTDHTNRTILVGTEASSYGMRAVQYETATPPTSFPSKQSYAVGLCLWAAAFDLRYGNAGEQGYGDAVVFVPRSGSYIHTFENVSDTLTVRSIFNPSVTGTIQSGNWSWDRDNGYLLFQFVTASNTFKLFQVNMSNLTVSSIGTCGTTTNNINAVGITADGFIITLEDTGGANDAIRTYSLSGTTLTPIDSFSITGESSSSAQIQVSPYTNRIWVCNTLATAHSYALVVDETGMIDIQYDTSKTMNNSGGFGNPIAFLNGPMATTTNGFTGIKQKLYECWEMNEASSTTRTGSMGNLNLSVDGTVNYRTGKISNAAEFTDGSSALQAATPLELYGTGTISFCLDVYLDSKTGTIQNFIGLHINDLVLPLGTNISWGARYNESAGRFEVYMASGSTLYIAQADDIGDPSTGQWYHIYGEYNTNDDEVKIRVNAGTEYTDAVSTVINHDSTYLVIGRLSTSASTRYPMDGAVDNVYVFWDALTPTEQEWMYNSGNSRAFADL